MSNLTVVFGIWQQVFIAPWELLWVVEALVIVLFLALGMQQQNVVLLVVCERKRAQKKGPFSPCCIRRK
jgi:hypothetical protein